MYVSLMEDWDSWQRAKVCTQSTQTRKDAHLHASMHTKTLCIQNSKHVSINTNTYKHVMQPNMCAHMYI